MSASIQYLGTFFLPNPHTREG